MLVLPVRRLLVLRCHAIIPDFGGDSATALLVGSGFIEGHVKDSRGGGGSQWGWMDVDKTYSDVSSAGQNFSAEHANWLLKQDDARLPGGSGCLLKCRRA